MSGSTSVIDFARSFCHYVPRGRDFMVRIQIECRCEVFDRASGASDEYMLGVRTQTGLRTDPPSDVLDPGYDFWMIFGKNEVLIRRVHASAHNRHPTQVPVDYFGSAGWRLSRAAAEPLETPADASKAVKAFRPIVARSEFSVADGSRGYAIEYPVKWADGTDEGAFLRVETGPVLMLDPERARVGVRLGLDDFQWSYLDYRDFDRVRCFIEQPTSILYGAAFRGEAPHGQTGGRRSPAISASEVAQIEAHVFSGWSPPVPVDTLRRLFETDHYSRVEHRPAKTRLFALEA